MGRTDAAIGYASMQQIRDAAIADHGVSPETVLDQAGNHTHSAWGPIETFDNAYETVADGPWADAKGHCIPGRTMDPYAPQYAIPCQLPDAFVWGEQVMTFFQHNPMP